MTVTKYIWDDLSDNVLMETDENGTVTVEYTNEPGLFGAPISQHRNGESSFFCFDGDGSTRQVTESDQNITDTETFTAYGEEVFKMGATKYPFRYKGIAGNYTDQETGEIYVRARTYVAQIGQWLSPDPLGLIFAVNLYAAYFVPSQVDSSGYLPCAVLGPATTTCGPLTPPLAIPGPQVLPQQIPGGRGPGGPGGPAIPGLPGFPPIPGGRTKWDNCPGCYVLCDVVVAGCFFAATQAYTYALSLCTFAGPFYWICAAGATMTFGVLVSVCFACYFDCVGSCNDDCTFSFCTS